MLSFFSDFFGRVLKNHLNKLETIIGFISHIDIIYDL